MTNPNKQQSNRPKVSVVCISYNQQDFITQTLEGFVMQKTDFNFEVIVADDASRDGTLEIIKKYAKKYPNIIRPILRKKNIGAQKNFIDAILNANGEYIALCEGDDYWTNSEKLQKQVNFLDNNPNYSLCFHPVNVLFENGEEPDTIFPKPEDGADFTVERLLRQNYIQTNSVMYRKKAYDSISTDILPLDWFLHLYHAQYGKIGFIDEVMGTYRRHDKGIWWESQRDITKIWREHGIGHLKLYNAMLELFGSEQKKRTIITAHINTMLENIYDLKEADDVKGQVAAEFPEETQRFISELRTKYMDIKNQFENISPQYESLKDEYDKLLQHSKNVEKQLELIQSSRVWRIRNKVARIIGKK